MGKDIARNNFCICSTHLPPTKRPPPSLAPRFVVGAEAVELFRKSGLDIDALKQIWLLADKDADGKLTPKEFCVAWHLIICVTKKGLPLPRTLPLSLVNFMANAPDVPHALPLSPPLSDTADTSRGMKSPSPRSMSGSSATSYSALRNSAPNAKLEEASTLSDADGVALQTATDSIKSVVEKSVLGSTTAADSVRKSAITVKELLRKLSTEKISLEAKVSEAVQDAAESSKRLETIVDEITELNDECGRLHVELQEALDSKINSQSKLIDAAGERQKLAQKIEDMRLQISQIYAEKNNVSARISSTQVSLAQNAERGAAYESDKTNLAADISTSQGELALLRSVLANLAGEKSAMDADVSAMRMRLDTTEAELERTVVLSKANGAEVAALKTEKTRLVQEKSSLLVEIATTAINVDPKLTSSLKVPEASFATSIELAPPPQPAQAIAPPEPSCTPPSVPFLAHEAPAPRAPEGAPEPQATVADAPPTAEETKLSARSKLERFRREKSMEKGSKSSLASSGANLELKEPDDGRPEPKVVVNTTNVDFGGFGNNSPPLSASGGFAAEPFAAFDAGFDETPRDGFGATFTSDFAASTDKKGEFDAGFDEDFGGTAPSATSDGFDASFGGGPTSTPFDSFGADSFAAFDSGASATASGTPFGSFGDSAFDGGTAPKSTGDSGFDAFSSSAGDDAFAKW